MISTLPALDVHHCVRQKSSCAFEFVQWHALGSRVELAMGAFYPVKDGCEGLLPSPCFTATISMLCVSAAKQ